MVLSTLPPAQANSGLRNKRLFSGCDSSHCHTVVDKNRQLRSMAVTKDAIRGRVLFRWSAGAAPHPAPR